MRHFPAYAPFSILEKKRNVFFSFVEKLIFLYPLYLVQVFSIIVAIFDLVKFFRRFIYVW